MIAERPDSITKLLSSTQRTFEIPVYQRNYVWKIEDCEKLFEDILDCIKLKRNHYFGNVVFYVSSRSAMTGYTRYILIDGQQRITTTMLLLAAIRDEEPDERNRAAITKTYLRNEDASEDLRIKLKQVETDRSVYESIVNDKLSDIDTSTVIYRNYKKFRALIKAVKLEHSYSSEDLMDGIERLHIIGIDLESEKEGSESPQVIFESINATGEPLSAADLLRNFLLLEVGIERQEEFYKDYWLTIERNIGNENISDFIRRYLTLITDEDVKKNTEYKEFKKKYHDYFDNADDAIKELARFSKYYRWVKKPEVLSKEHPKTAKRLQDLDDLRMIPATATIMWLLEKADTQQIDFDDVDDVFDIIASWSFRARITNIINTGEIGNILTSVILKLLKEKQDNKTYADYLWFELSNYRLRDIYPSNAVFMDAFVRYDFYKNYRRYAQEKLASTISHDQTDIVLESIEHIMPQTLSADKWPGVSVSEHAEWVNTIGNLTPLNMPDNIDNSNHSFIDKISNIKNSDWQITREIDTEHGWDIGAIQKRGRELAEVASKVWRAPAERTREIELARINEKADLNQKFIEWIDDLNLPYIKLDVGRSINGTLRFTTTFMDSVIPARKGDDGIQHYGPATYYARSGTAYYYELKSKANGWARITLTLCVTDANELQLAGQNKLMDALNKHPSKADWTWYSPTGWTLESGEDDGDLKSKLRQVLEEEIPHFEHDIKATLGPEELGVAKKK